MDVWWRSTILTVAAGNDHVHVHSGVFFDELQRRESALVQYYARYITSTQCWQDAARGSQNLFNGFGSHGVDEADWCPIQCDVVYGPCRFRYQGLLQSFLQPAVSLLVLRGDVSEDLVGHPLLVELIRLGGKGFIRLQLSLISPDWGETQRWERTNYSIIKYYIIHRYKVHTRYIPW